MGHSSCSLLSAVATPAPAGTLQGDPSNPRKSTYVEHDAQLIKLGREQRKLWPPAALVAVLTTPRRMALVLDLPILYSAPDIIVRQALRPLFQARPAQAADSDQACIGGCSPDTQGPLVHHRSGSTLHTQLALLAGLLCSVPRRADGRLGSLFR